MIFVTFRSSNLTKNGIFLIHKKANIITKIKNYIDDALQINSIVLDLVNHPKLLSLDFKYKGLEVERRLKQNNLLPKIDLQYNFLNETPEMINSFNTENYKAGLAISFPLFLRKERAELKLNDYKLRKLL